MLIRRKKREPNDFIQYQFVFFTSKDNDFKCFRFLERAYNSIPDKGKKRYNKKKIKG